MHLMLANKSVPGHTLPGKQMTKHWQNNFASLSQKGVEKKKKKNKKNSCKAFCVIPKRSNSETTAPNKFDKTS